MHRVPAATTLLHPPISLAMAQQNFVHSLPRNPVPVDHTASTGMDLEIGRKIMSTLAEINNRFQGACPIGCATSEGLPQWSEALNILVERLLLEETFKTQFSQLKSNFERFRYCFEHSTINSEIEEYFTAFWETKSNCSCGEKNEETAAILRVRGNSFFVKEENVKALVCYTTGLMYAPEDSQEAPFLYGNRSAVFREMKQYENALEDIEQAMVLGYESHRPAGRLLLRKAECYALMGDLITAKLIADNPENQSKLNNLTNRELIRWSALKIPIHGIWLGSAPYVRSVALDRFQDVNEVIGVLEHRGTFTPNEKYPWLSSKVDVRFAPGKGHYLVANQPISYEEVIALEKPYTGVPLDVDHSQVSCHHCFTSCYLGATYLKDNAMAIALHGLPQKPVRISAPLPCRFCSSVLYCSAYCRDASWEAYHRFECAELPLLNVAGAEARLALRMLYSAGDFPTAKKVLLDCAGKMASSLLEEIPNPNEYSMLFKTMSAPVEDLEAEVRKAITSCMLVKLNSNSGYNVDEELFFGTALLTHLSQLAANRCISLSTRIKLNQSESDYYFLYASGVRSLIPHQCVNANVGKNAFCGTSLFQTSALNWTATRDIPAGSQLTIADHSERDEPKTEAHCRCATCIHQGHYPIACPRCHAGLMLNYSAPDGSFGCSLNNCGHQMSATELAEIITRVVSLEERANTIADVFKAERSATLTRSEHEGAQNQLDALGNRLEELLYPQSRRLAVLYEKLTWASIVVAYLHRNVPSHQAPQLQKYLYYFEKTLIIYETLAGGRGRNSIDVETFLRDYLVVIFGRGGMIHLSPYGNEAINVAIAERQEMAKARLAAIRRFVPFEYF